MLGEEHDDEFLAYSLAGGVPTEYFALLDRTSSELLQLYAMRRTQQWIEREKDDDE